MEFIKESAFSVLPPSFWPFNHKELLHHMKQITATRHNWEIDDFKPENFFGQPAIHSHEYQHGVESMHTKHKTHDFEISIIDIYFLHQQYTTFHFKSL